MVTHVCSFSLQPLLTSLSHYFEFWWCIIYIINIVTVYIHTLQSGWSCCVLLAQILLKKHFVSFYCSYFLNKWLAHYLIVWQQEVKDTSFSKHGRYISCLDNAKLFLLLRYDYDWFSCYAWIYKDEKKKRKHSHFRAISRCVATDWPCTLRSVIKAAADSWPTFFA